MTDQFQDQMLVALRNEIQRDPMQIDADADAADGRARSLVPRVAVAAAIVAVAGTVVVVVADGTSDRAVSSGAKRSSPSSAPAAEPEASTPVYVMGSPVGTVYRVPLDSLPKMSGGDQLVDGEVRFRLADADPRLSRMRVLPWTGPDMGNEVVETVGTRVISRPAGLSFPAGMDESTITGPWFFREADGTQWMADGLMADLRVALPDLAYVDGKMMPGPSLVSVGASAAPPPVTVSDVRDARFDVQVSKDTTSDLSYVDPGGGRLELVDVNGHAGARSTGGTISWRIDGQTVVSVSPVPGTSATNEEMLAAARAVRPATAQEIGAMKVWRGQAVERVVVHVPKDVPRQVVVDPSKTSGGSWASSASAGAVRTQLRVDVADLDAAPGSPMKEGFSAVVDDTEADGFALPVGPDTVGHHLRLTLGLADQEWVTPPAGSRGCSATVVVPPEGAPPVEVTLTATC